MPSYETINRHDRTHLHHNEYLHPEQCYFGYTAAIRFLASDDDLKVVEKAISPMNIRESYDSAAEAYAAHLINELAQKPLDRHLLNRFAEEVHGQGVVADLGCGPGHVTHYLHGLGINVVGIDLSPEMIKVAKRLNPELAFQVGDMERLDAADGTFTGVVAFYSIVHAEPAQLPRIMHEMRRVLKTGGVAMVSFHVGEQVLHVEDLFGAKVSLEFRFHTPENVVEALRTSSLRIVERIEREAYEGVEYPSRRCYLLAKAV